MKTKLSRFPALSPAVVAMLAILNAQPGDAAPMGTAFTYQGKLTSGTNAANGVYDFIFVMWNAATFGVNQGPTIITNGVPVANGYFMVPLDFGNVFPGDARWLEISVRTNGAASYTLLAPRQQLTPAPYSLFASNSATLGGQFPSYYAPASGLTAYVAKSGDTMSGTLNLPANGLVAGSSQFVLSGGSVGIGTASPAAKLEVNGLVKADSDLMAARMNVGTGHTLSGLWSTICGGSNNAASGDYSIVGGGFGNTASGPYNVVGGGNGNTAWNWGAAVGGGYANWAYGIGATIGGGGNNNAAATDCTIAGGFRNTASGYYATVGGGSNNMASADYSIVGGGQANTANSPSATVGGGAGNAAQNWNATVSGGWGNIASGGGDTVGGGDHNTASGGDSSVAGGADNNAQGMWASVGGGQLNIASGYNSTVAGGAVNYATAYGSTVAGGAENTASGIGSFVGGGGWDGTTFAGNSAVGKGSTVSGGLGNAATNYAAVGGGWYNQATGTAATVPGGFMNTASGSEATVGGGDQNTASAFGAMVPGGWNNAAAGWSSFAAGTQAKATQNGAFVWADYTMLDYNPYSYPQAGGVANSFNVRAQGGVYFVTAVNGTSGQPTAGLYVSGGGSGWNSYSDRNAKTNFKDMDGRDVLDRLISIPIKAWNYKTQDESVRHIGPMAQDFNAAFGTGEADKVGAKKYINSVDADGVALAAIQGLNQKVEEKDAEIQALKQSVAELKAMVEKLTGK